MQNLPYLSSQQLLTYPPPLPVSLSHFLVAKVCAPVLPSETQKLSPTFLIIALEQGQKQGLF